MVIFGAWAVTLAECFPHVDHLTQEALQQAQLPRYGSRRPVSALYSSSVEFYFETIRQDKCCPASSWSVRNIYTEVLLQHAVSLFSGQKPFIHSLRIINILCTFRVNSLQNKEFVVLRMSLNSCLVFYFNVFQILLQDFCCLLFLNINIFQKTGE